jgi:hypothetical protein
LGSEWTRLSKRKRRGPLSSEEIAIERRIYWHAEQRKREAQERRQARAAARADHYEQTGNWFPGRRGRSGPEAAAVIATRRYPPVQRSGTNRHRPKTID